MGRGNIGNVLSEDMFISDMGFLITYYIDTTLLVMIHILCTQKWAAECNPPLQMTQAFVANTYV